VENRLSELFPIQSIGPLIGGAILWFDVPATHTTN